VIVGAFLFLSPIWAGEAPNFITYTHQMEEPGNLEIDTKGVVGKPDGGGRFLGSSMEFEYGATAWWTTEFYLDGQVTAADSTLFTGFRWENRLRMLPREHWINPVLYVEFENINGADKSLLEVVGHDGNDDLIGPNDEARREKKREIETKLILGSYFKGLGTHKDFGLTGTSHYVAPTFAWQMPNGPLLRFSPGFGVTGQSLPVLFRFSVSYEVAQAGRAIREMFAGGKGNR
jgi:hypothetical protein